MKKLPFGIFKSRHISSLNSTKHNSGQALLVILLTMSVALTVALSVSSRSVVDITTTTYEEDALRAFSAAEAGVEEALITRVGVVDEQIDPTVDPSLTFTSEVTTLDPGNQHHYRHRMRSGQVAAFWFVDRNSSGEFVCDTGRCLSTTDLELCWGEAGTPSEQARTPAVQVLLFYDDYDVPIPGSLKATAIPNNFEDVRVEEYTFDPNGTRGNNFTPATIGCSWDLDYAFSATINIANLTPYPPACVATDGCILFAGVRMLYNNGPGGRRHGLALDAGGPLPPQGIEIESTGEAGDSTRKVKVVQGHPEPQHGFWGAMFGKGSI